MITSGGSIHEVQEVIPRGLLLLLVPDVEGSHHARQPGLLLVRLVLPMGAKHEDAAAAAPGSAAFHARVVVTKQVEFEVVGGLMGGMELLVAKRIKRKVKKLKHQSEGTIQCNILCHNSPETSQG